MGLIVIRVLKGTGWWCASMRARELGSEGAGVWNKRSVHEVAAMGGFALQLVRKKLPMDPHERPVVTEENKVAMRAGSTGNHVRYVVIASTALVILAFIAIALFVK